MKVLFLIVFALLSPELLTARLQLSFTPGSSGFSIFDSDGRSVKFRLVGVSSTPQGPPVLDFPGNFVMMDRTTWTTSAYVVFGFHPVKLFAASTGRVYMHFSSVDEEPSSTVVGQVNYPGVSGLPPRVRSVVNAFSQEPILSPSALITIIDPNLSSLPVYGEFDMFGRYPTRLGIRSVTINGISAPVLSVSADRINSIVPYEVEGQSTAEIVLTGAFGRGPSMVFSVPIRDTSPAILTESAGGRGAAAARQLVDYEWTLNGERNPAPPGAVIELVSTGAGSWGRTLDSDIAFGEPVPLGSFNSGLGYSGAWNFVARPVTVTIGGLPARILYAGTARYRPFGVLQVNAIVPTGIGSGPQFVVLKVGENDNAEQRVTIFVQ